MNGINEEKDGTDGDEKDEDEKDGDEKDEDEKRVTAQIEEYVVLCHAVYLNPKN